ncbi:MAG TPA: hypothetical protein VM308_05090 [Sphingomicrobium sp.]|nr:hypothetical protein [Sphingomicrobium sp.]
MGSGAIYEQRRRPWRVVPLAVAAVALTIAASAGAMSTIRHLTDDHYAADVLLEKLAALDPRHDPADS